MSDAQLKAAAALKAYARRRAREDLCLMYDLVFGDKGWVAAAHHTLLMQKLQAVTDRTLIHSRTGNPCTKLMVLMPPGSAKSQITSVLFPIWFLQRRSNSNILASSYASTLIEKFSRQCRNTVEAHAQTLGYNLSPDSRSVETWSTTNGGTYKCLGVTAGLSGYRFNAGIIDDYLGSQEDADSQTMRDKIWDWWQADFQTRGEGGTERGNIQVIVANRRHEDDLVGRILASDSDSWEVIKIPFIAKEGDALGRQPGERLWPEYYTDSISAPFLRLPPRIFSGLFQQEPAPEEGNYFKRDWLRTYSRNEYDALMRKNPRIYGAGDWAVSEDKDANRTCFGGVAVDEDGLIYVLPDLFWKTAGPKEVVDAFVDFLRRRTPMTFRSESGHISKAWGPFLRDAMREAHTYCYIEEVTPAKGKDVRARSVQGLMSMHRVRFPEFATWWPAAIHELLMFPGRVEDDFVDFLAHVGALVTDMLRLQIPKVPTYESLNKPHQLTLADIKRLDLEARRAELPRYSGR